MDANESIIAIRPDNKYAPARQKWRHAESRYFYSLPGYMESTEELKKECDKIRAALTSNTRGIITPHFFYLI